MAQPVKIVSSCSSDASRELAAYAAAHGIPIALQAAAGPSAYSKTHALLEAAVEPPAASWLWWLDCDTLLLEKNVTAQSLLEDALAASRVDVANHQREEASTPSPELIFSYETWGENQPISSGSFFVRNDRWGADFLHEWSRHCEQGVRRGKRLGMAGAMLHGFNRRVWCAFKDQEMLSNMDGFEPVPPRSRAPHRFFGGRAVALADAPFNALLCTSLVRPLRPVVFHAARGRHALGRCDPYFNPWRNLSKASVLRAVRTAGLAPSAAACCGGFQPVVNAARRAGDLDARSSLDHLAYRRYARKRSKDPRVREAVRLIQSTAR